MGTRSQRRKNHTILAFKRQKCVRRNTPWPSQGAKLLPTISTRHRWIKNEVTATRSLGPIVVGVANHRAFTKSFLNQLIITKRIVNHINNIAYYSM